MDSELFYVGYDSLMAVELRSKLHDILQTTIPIEYFTNNPSIETLSQRIWPKLEKKQLEKSKQSNEIYESPVCDYQFVLWVLSALGNNSFNLAMQLRLNGPLDIDIAEQAFKHVVHQNDTFWITFDKELPIQRLTKVHNQPIHFEYSDKYA